MKINKTLSYVAIIIISITLLSVACSNIKTSRKISGTSSKTDLFQERTVNDKTKKYWFDGTAEISSYKLDQARYGEIHKGKAVLIFVTEPFSKTSNTKADHPNKNTPVVLKLNSTKKFNTGIYPYSIMTSTFFPFEKENTSFKIALSMQEWCGMTYMEMKKEKELTLNKNSYFEGQSFNNKKININILEDDLWSLIRLNPNTLPTGKHSVIPSFSYMNLTHKQVKAYQVSISLNTNSNTKITTYKLNYPSLERVLEINFSSEFPYKILNWNESYYSGYGTNRKIITTKATLIKTIKIDYWNKNKNQDLHLRDSLGI